MLICNILVILWLNTVFFSITLCQFTIAAPGWYLIMLLETWVYMLDAKSTRKGRELPLLFGVALQASANILKMRDWFYQMSSFLNIYIFLRCSFMFCNVSGVKIIKRSIRSDYNSSSILNSLHQIPAQNFLKDSNDILPIAQLFLFSLQKIFLLIWLSLAGFHCFYFLSLYFYWF